MAFIGAATAIKIQADRHRLGAIRSAIGKLSSFAIGAMGTVSFSLTTNFL